MKNITFFVIALFAVFVLSGCASFDGSDRPPIIWEGDEIFTSTLNKEAFYGTFAMANGNRTMIISENSFTYLFPGGNPPTNVVCRITRWNEVSFNVQNGSANGIQANTTVKAMEIICVVEEVLSQTIGNQMNALFGLPNATAVMEPGHIFSVWLLCNDPALISSPSSVHSGGINIGFVNDQGRRAAPWPNFFKQ